MALPVSRRGGSGYWDTLTVSADGTFTKHQQFRGHSELYRGAYTRNQHGLYLFHVVEKEYDGGGEDNPETFVVNKTLYCRFATDDAGNLLVHEIHGDPELRFAAPDECNVIWKCYSSR